MVKSCPQTDSVYAYAVAALPVDDMSRMEAHIASCRHCRRELEDILPVVTSFVSWPADVLQPPPELWWRMVRRIAADTGRPARVDIPKAFKDPEWRDVGNGISCKVLSTDADAQRVSMLVRLAPGADYPPHTHADVEELFLLDGELMIDDRKLYPGDYNRAAPGTSDARVWSETGCTCVLITSTRDRLL